MKLNATSAQNSFKYSWLLSRIFPYIKPYLFRIFLGFLIAIPLGLLDGVTAFALKPYMDYVIGGKSFDFSIMGHAFSVSSIQMAIILPLGVVLFAATQGVLRYLNDYISTWSSQKITNDVKISLFHKLINMHPQFFDENSSGVIIQRYMSDPQVAATGIVDQIKTITTSVFGALGLIAVMLYSSWRLAFVGVLVLCIAFIPVALIRKRIKNASNKTMVIGGNLTTSINETYSGNKVIAAYELQDRQEKYFKNQTWEGFNVAMSLVKRSAWMSPLMYLIASLGIAFVLGYGTYLINTNFIVANIMESKVLDRIENNNSLTSIIDKKIPTECKGCVYENTCAGGVYDRRYLWYGTLERKDPYCPGKFILKNNNPIIIQNYNFKSVHDGYLPTIFFKP